MKKIVSCISLLLFLAFFKPASAQFQYQGNAHQQPTWGLSGQDHVEYYYLPDIDTYYYVPGKQFIYRSGSSAYWTFSSSLPAANRLYDLRSANKVVINEAGAYRYHAEHKAKFGTSASNAVAPKSQDEKQDKQANNSVKTSG